MFLQFAAFLFPFSNIYFERYVNYNLLKEEKEIIAKFFLPFLIYNYNQFHKYKKIVRNKRIRPITFPVG